MKDYKCWRYSLRAPKREDCKDDDEHNWRRFEWAIIILDSNGMFAAVSDYGDYIYHWSHFREDFRRFMLGVGWDYLLGKTRGHNAKELQVDSSKELIREAILDYRRHDADMTKDLARREWDLINDVDNEEDLRNWLDETEYFNDDGCGYEYFRYDWGASEHNFVKLILPRLKAEIRQQLKQEREEATTALIAARRELRRDKRVVTPVC